MLQSTKRNRGQGNTRGKNKRWLTESEAVAYIVERRSAAVQLIARAAATKRKVGPETESERRKNARLDVLLVVARSLRMGFATHGEAHRPILEAHEELAERTARGEIEPKATKDGLRYSWPELKRIWKPAPPGRRKKTILGAEPDDQDVVKHLISQFLSKPRPANYTIDGTSEYLGLGLSKTRFTRVYKTALQGAAKEIVSDLESDSISDSEAQVLRAWLATWRIPRGRPRGSRNRNLYRRS